MRKWSALVRELAARAKAAEERAEKAEETVQVLRGRIAALDPCTATTEEGSRAELGC